MQVMKFVYARNRICETNNCYNCPLGRRNNGFNLDCRDLIYRHPEATEAIVKNWIKEHKEEMEP